LVPQNTLKKNTAEVNNQQLFPDIFRPQMAGSCEVHGWWSESWW